MDGMTKINILLMKENFIFKGNVVVVALIIDG